MRGQLYIDHSIAREIRPIDIKNTIDAVLFTTQERVSNEEWSTALFANTDLIDGERTEKAIAAFYAINAAYLATASPAETPSLFTSHKKLIRLRDHLNKSCAVLIHLGHRDCWYYGWRFFIEAQSLYEDK